MRYTTFVLNKVPQMSKEESELALSFLLSQSAFKEIERMLCNKQVHIDSGVISMLRAVRPELAAVAAQAANDHQTVVEVYAELCDATRCVSYAVANNMDPSELLSTLPTVAAQTLQRELEKRGLPIAPPPSPQSAASVPLDVRSVIAPSGRSMFSARRFAQRSLAYKYTGRFPAKYRFLEERYKDISAMVPAELVGVRVEPNGAEQFFALAFKKELSDLEAVLENGAEGNGQHVVDEARQSLMRQLMLAVAHVHGLGVAHRDIKLGNLLIDQHGVLKLADFGEARTLAEEMTSCLRMGTLFYKDIAQISSNPASSTTYDAYAGDVWSAGICALALVFRQHPLDVILGQNLEGTHEAFCAAVMGLVPPGGNGISISHIASKLKLKVASNVDVEEIQLYESMLRLNPADRPSFVELLLHPAMATVPVPCAHPAVYPPDTATDAPSPFTQTFRSTVDPTLPNLEADIAALDALSHHWNVLRPGFKPEKQRPTKANPVGTSDAPPAQHAAAEPPSTPAATKAAAKAVPATPKSAAPKSAAKMGAVMPPTATPHGKAGSAPKVAPKKLIFPPEPSVAGKGH
eukprot:TRINITY_DN612_c1_g1_i1.p1 TRINITY_DN612_c1_g1~~TRINITY_DN612_c1_g1_i1.p1  ORF type:complete len:576 (-),score=188.44 TRINITY_DN612_c1_g1_i1:7-1734(-)